MFLGCKLKNKLPKLLHPLLDEITNSEKFASYGKEAMQLINSAENVDPESGKLYQYIWDKPSTGQKAEKLGQSVYLPNWDWVIGSGLYLDDVKAQIGAIQKELDDSVQQTRWVLILLSISAIAFTSMLLAFVRFSEQKFADTRLKELATEIVNAQENERKRVSSDLHDGISQLLVSARYSLDVAASKAEKHPAIQAPIDKSMETIVNAISEIRRISIALRPSILDDVGLAAAIKSLGSDFEQQTGIKTVVNADNVGKVLDDREKTSLYRVAQEALANIAKHSQANEVKIALKQSKYGIIMSIEDDGIGLKTEPRSSGRKGLGLRNMKERIASHDGTFKLSENNPNGLKLQVFLNGRSTKEES